MKLSLIVPCYNESQSLEAFSKEVFGVLDSINSSPIGWAAGFREQINSINSQHEYTASSLRGGKADEAIKAIHNSESTRIADCFGSTSRNDERVTHKDEMVTHNDKRVSNNDKVLAHNDTADSLSFELIFINDGSKDNTIEILHALEQLSNSITPPPPRISRYKTR